VTAAGAQRRFADAVALVRHRAAPAATLAVLGLGGLWAGCPPWEWGALLAGLAALGLLPGVLARLAVVAAAALLGYAFGLTASPSLALTGGVAALAACRLAALPRGPRGRAIAATAACLAALGAVYVVLWRGHFAAEEAFLGALGIGLAAGVAAYTAAYEVVLASGSRRLAVGTVAVAVAAAALSLARPAAGRDAQLPGWRPALAALRAMRDCRAPAAVVALERLRVGGYRDAALALAGVALLDNADPSTLRGLCPRRGTARGVAEACGELVELGYASCAAVSEPDEVGARALADSSHAALQRLRGDLLFEAGELEPGIDAYSRAVVLGDELGGADVVRGLLDRGLGARAASLAATLPMHPRIALWLGGPGDARVAWNESLRFDTLEPPSRVGVVLSAAPGELTAVFDHTLARWTLSVTSRYLDSFVMTMPLPPGGGVPQHLSMRLKDRTGVTLEFVNTRGESLTYACAPSFDRPTQKQRPLPAAVCDGLWGEADLHPGAELAGPLARWTLAGEFSLAEVALAPAAGAAAKGAP